jgi:hypothetical protein
MTKTCGVLISLAMIAAFSALAGAQQGGTDAVRKTSSKPKSTPKSTPAPRERPLVLTEAIPLENAKGRFDHFAMGGGRLFVAALGSNAVEAIDIGGRILDNNHGAQSTGPRAQSAWLTHLPQLNDLEPGFVFRGS